MTPWFINNLASFQFRIYYLNFFFFSIYNSVKYQQSLQQSKGISIYCLLIQVLPEQINIEHENQSQTMVCSFLNLIPPSTLTLLFWGIFKAFILFQLENTADFLFCAVLFHAIFLAKSKPRYEYVVLLQLFSKCGASIGKIWSQTKLNEYLMI